MMVSHSRHEKRSRTVSMILCRAGIFSNVWVTCSPSLVSLSEPQHEHDVANGMTTRSVGR